MYIGALLAASGIAHVMEQENAFFACIPGVGNAVTGGGVLVVTYIRAVRGLYIVIHAKDMQ